MSISELVHNGKRIGVELTAAHALARQIDEASIAVCLTPREGAGKSGNLPLFNGMSAYDHAADPHHRSPLWSLNFSDAITAGFPRAMIMPHLADEKYEVQGLVRGVAIAEIISPISHGAESYFAVSKGEGTVLAQTRTLPEMHYKLILEHELVKA